MALTGKPPGPEDPPRPTGRERHVDLTGYILPVDEDSQPMWLVIIGLGTALPVFSSLAALIRAAVAFPAIVVYARLKRIDDGPAFLSSIPPSVPIVADVRPSERGTVLYDDVRR